MTDSMMNANAGDGAFDLGATDDLFGEGLEETPDVDGDGDGDANPNEPTVTDDTEPSTGVAGSPSGVEDQTAAAVFGQLQESVTDTDDVDTVLEDESPEEIIASADEPAPEPHDDVDDDLLLDEDALEDLLLTDRTKEQEFLWIETDADSSPDDAETAIEADDDEPDADTNEPSATDEHADANPTDGASVDATGTMSEPAAADRAATELFGESSTASSSSEGVTADGDETTGSGSTSLAIDGDDTTADTTATATTDGDATDDVDVEDPSSADEPEATEIETALVTKDGSDVPATTDEEDSGGPFGWLRSKLGGLF